MNIDKLNNLKNAIDKLDKIHHLKIFKILKDNEVKYSENRNGIFINMTSLKDLTITQLEDYLKYVNKQEKQLSDIEAQKDELSNTYFKDNKDNSSIQLNA